MDFKVKIDSNEYNCILNDGYEPSFNKLWDEDTGRTYVNGSFKGTLIGTFPKLSFNFAPRTADELSKLMSDLDKPSVTVEFYHAKVQKYIKQKFTPNDYGLALKTAVTMEWNAFKVTFTAEERQVV